MFLPTGEDELNFFVIFVHEMAVVSIGQAEIDVDVVSKFVS
jgi:hypothetical protein